ACEGMPKSSNMGHDLGELPLPACGGRVGVRGTHQERNSWRLPLTRPAVATLRRVDLSPQAGRGKSKQASPIHQRTTTVLQRAERFLRRNGRAQVIEVARILGLLRLLHLEQIGRMQL